MTTKRCNIYFTGKDNVSLSLTEEDYTKFKSWLEDDRNYNHCLSEQPPKYKKCIFLKNQLLM